MFLIHRKKVRLDLRAHKRLSLEMNCTSRVSHTISYRVTCVIIQKVLACVHSVSHTPSMAGTLCERIPLVAGAPGELHPSMAGTLCERIPLVSGAPCGSISGPARRLEYGMLRVCSGYAQGGVD